MRMKSVVIKAAMAVGILGFATPSFAINSCWQASDPPGCWLQCNFGGPCPVPWYVNARYENVNYNLNNSNSKLYKEVVSIIKKDAKKDKRAKSKKALKVKKGVTLYQTCSANKLLETIKKYHNKPDVVKQKCFREKKVYKKANVVPHKAVKKEMRTN